VSPFQRHHAIEGDPTGVSRVGKPSSTALHAKDAGTETLVFSVADLPGVESVIAIFGNCRQSAPGFSRIINNLSGPESGISIAISQMSKGETRC
jgi:hypothetical protein